MAVKALRYRDEESALSVYLELIDSGTEFGYQVRVYKEGDLVCSAYAEDIKNAQALARIIVGIEMQSDGAAWKRGPRGPAMPTDADGHIIDEEGRQ